MHIPSSNEPSETILKPFLCMDLDAPGVTDRTGSVEGVIDGLQLHIPFSNEPLETVENHAKLSQLNES